MLSHATPDLDAPPATLRRREDLILEELSLLPARHRPSPAQMERFTGHVAEILSALGLDRDTPSARDTPRRFLQAMVEATDGYGGDPKLVTAFPTECRGRSDCELAQIVEGPIEFT